MEDQQGEGQQDQGAGQDQGATEAPPAKPAEKPRPVRPGPNVRGTRPPEADKFGEKK